MTAQDNFLNVDRKLFSYCEIGDSGDREVPEAPLVQSGAPNLLTYMNVPHLATGPKDPLLALEKRGLDALPPFHPWLRARFNDVIRNFLPLGIRAIIKALGRLSRMRGRMRQSAFRAVVPTRSHKTR